MLVQAGHVVEQDPVVQGADGVHVRHRPLAEHLQLQLDLGLAGRLVQDEQAVPPHFESNR